jgi:ABC-type branched-subunit amino acid transport system ATPase component/ABC-type branched-subunit amino acid transport system permease subunit
VFPWLPGVGTSTLAAANLAAAYTLVAVSLVVLTGWVGQISLAHAAFVGIGAYATGWAAAGLGIPFPLSLPFAMAASALGAALLGIVALRVRGLFLAVATLIFSWMSSEFLFRQRWLTKHDLIPARLIGGEGTLPSFDFTSRRTFFYVAWAIASAAVFIGVNLRDSKTGRAFFAIKGSETATASLGIDVIRYKLLAFAISGALAGAAGNLMMSNSRAVTPDQFTFTISLFFLSIAVVGGLRSLGGSVASALLFASLSEIFFRIPSLSGYLEFVSAALLAVTLLVYPSGMAGLASLIGLQWRRLEPRLARRPMHTANPARPPSVRLESLTRLLPKQVRRLTTTATKRLGAWRRPGVQPEPFLDWALPAPETNGNGAGHHSSDAVGGLLHTAQNGNGRLSVTSHRTGGYTRPEVERTARRVLVEAADVTVRFGGLTAIANASLQVCEGEITGLIGPNGAGKTTLFNTIAGFVAPTEGGVRLFGTDVTSMAVHARARLGVARTFQAIQLFSQLTVFENLLVATHLQNPSTAPAHMVVTRSALKYEGEARRRVRHALALLDLEYAADRRVADLPFGVLRMVELARAMVTGFRVMMLDEPASGLDNSETDRLIEVVQFIRDLGVTVLLIEHDVRMVTAVSDYLYVLDRGRMIAQGPAEAIQRDPAVIAAYLGEPVKEAVA